MDQAISTDQILTAGLQSVDTPNTRAVLKSPDLYAFLLASFNNTIKLTSGRPVDIVVGLTNKSLTVGKLIGKTSDNNNVMVGMNVAQMLVITANLATIAGKGPGGAVATIGAALAKKTSLALGLAGNDDKRAKCLAAATDLAAALLTTAAVAPTACTGIGMVVVAGSVAQIFLSAYQTHQACLKD